jgi:hypothetical protein
MFPSPSSSLTSSPLSRSWRTFVVALYQTPCCQPRMVRYALTHTATWPSTTMELYLTFPASAAATDNSTSIRLDVRCLPGMAHRTPRARVTRSSRSSNDMCWQHLSSHVQNGLAATRAIDPSSMVLLSESARLNRPREGACVEDGTCVVNEDAGPEVDTPSGTSRRG